MPPGNWILYVEDSEDDEVSWGLEKKSHYTSKSMYQQFCFGGVLSVPERGRYVKKLSVGEELERRSHTVRAQELCYLISSNKEQLQQKTERKREACAISAGSADSTH